MMQLAIRYHRVNITIQDQVAITEIDQVFYNPNNWSMEGLYLFPVPTGAAISSFNLWIDGKPVTGQILEAEQARQQYWEIVRGLRDPALLEYIDRGAFQARIFPIPPQGERRIELKYVQTLEAENGLVRYIYPLSTEKYSLWPLEQATIKVDIRSSQRIRAIYSPSHAVQIHRPSAYQAEVDYEANQVIPDKDFVIYFSSGEEQAFHLLTYRDPQDPANPDGYFMLILAPRPETSPQALPKDVILVLDRSGSMEGEKFRQTQDALRFILEQLLPEDRFNLLAFSTGIETFSTKLSSIEAIPDAIRWVEGLSALGSTDINRALLEAAALASPERPTYLIFLTDGLPTEGIIDSQQILDNLGSSAPDNLRLFSFGVGYDVDTFLLDSLAQAHHGANTYVIPGEKIDEILSTFYAKISAPLLTDLKLDFGDIGVYDIFPQPLPDLFIGSQILLTGRYRQGGQSTVILSGKVGTQSQEFRYEDLLFNQAMTTDPVLATIPQLWATRKIGYLLNHIRLQGADAETVEQIVRLSIRYGIITPYTSYLVSEAAPLGSAAQERLALEQYDLIQHAPVAPAFGQAAVEKSALQGAMTEAEVPLTMEPAIQQYYRTSRAHSFVLQDGVWIDTTFDPETMQTQKIGFLSPEYLALVNTDPQIAAAFALGPSVIAISQGIAYEVIAEGNLPPAPFTTLQITPTVGTSHPESSLPDPISAGSSSRTGDPTPSPSLCLSGFIMLSLLSVGIFSLRRYKL